MTINELKNKLSKHVYIDKNNYATQFKEIAELLFNHAIIKKGDKEYWFTDIEFYLYTSEHRDIITYPRCCDGGQWFFHASGVDLSFESFVDFQIKNTTKREMPYLTEDAYFGGILIRGIKQVMLKGETIITEINYNGPIKVCDELFDNFDAFGKATNFPEIQIKDHATNNLIIQTTRHALLSSQKTSEEKVDSILSNNYSKVNGSVDHSKLYDGFKEHLNSKYRFYIK